MRLSTFISIMSSLLLLLQLQRSSSRCPPGCRTFCTHVRYYWI